jgi:Protein of unknown function (DUF2490)
METFRVPTISHGSRVDVGDLRVSCTSGLYFLMFVFWFTIEGASIARGQTEQFEFLPQIDAYKNFTEKIQGEFVISRTGDAATFSSIQVGPNLNISLRPLLRGKLLRTNETSYKLLTLGVGYRYVANIEKPPENRGIIEITARFPLPGKLQLSDRNRADLRVIQGQFSWRYRNRNILERSFAIHKYPITPYGQAEFYYNSQSDTWDKKIYQLGLNFPVHKRAELNPYYERQNDTSKPNHVNAFGFTLSLYF